MIVKIDTSKWITMWQYTKQKGITRQVLSNWIRRGKVETKMIDELDLTLIRINSETVRTAKNVNDHP